MKQNKQWNKVVSFTYNVIDIIWASIDLTCTSLDLFWASIDFSWASLDLMWASIDLIWSSIDLTWASIDLTRAFVFNENRKRQVNIEVNDQWLFTVNKYVYCSCGYLFMFTGFTHLINVILIPLYIHLLRKTFCFELRFLGLQSLNFVSKPGNRFVLQRCEITANRNKRWPLSTL